MPLRRTRDAVTGLLPTERRRNRRRVRDYQDEYARRKLLNEWRATYGDYCPGAPDLNHPPHRSSDLTVDHVVRRRHGGTPAHGLRVLCRPLNSRRG